MKTGEMSVYGAGRGGGKSGVMGILQRRFTSGNNVPVESVRITWEEFEVIQYQIASLEDTVRTLEADIEEYVDAQPPI